MKKLTLFFCFLTLLIFSVNAEVSLRNLIEYDQAVSLDRLEKATNEELWDAFLEGQSELFFEPEFRWMTNQDWWGNVKSILEIGSGNGAYLSKLADQFHEKTFQGIEKLSSSVKQANERYARDRVAFQEGNAELFHEQLSHSSEVVLFRLTLQHLKEPLLALQNAWHYLVPNGHVLIIDSYDLAKRTSHPITSIDNALGLVAESQKNNNEAGNRKITLEILQMLENKSSQLSEFYEMYSSNLDAEGNVLRESVRLEGEQTRRLYFNHALLFLTLVHRTYQVEVDLEKAYEELKEYLEDENAWTALGLHYLILKKKPTI